MNSSQLISVAGVGIGFFVLALSSSVSAEETCASKYPNAPTEPPRGYDYKNEIDAYMAMRREARKAGYTAIKKGTRDRARRGPCVGYGEHVNMKGMKPASKGKKKEWAQLGSMTSCQICEDTPRGPKLYRTVWYIHKDF